MCTHDLRGELNTAVDVSNVVRRINRDSCKQVTTSAVKMTLEFTELKDGLGAQLKGPEQTHVLLVDDLSRS